MLLDIKAYDKWTKNKRCISWASCQIRKIAGAHAPGMPGTFSPSPQVSYPDMHHGTCVTHVPWCMPGSLTSGFLWNRWRGKRSRHSRRMRNLQFYVSGKRPMVLDIRAFWRSHAKNSHGCHIIDTPTQTEILSREHPEMSLPVIDYCKIY